MADTKRIEEEAVDAVKRTIRTVELLSPYISENDKGPCWDGYIAVHKDEKKSKDGIRRVFVQVKGTEKNDLSQDEIKYSTLVNDLEAYRVEGGVIYFVVYEKYIEGERFPQTKIYYQELLPYKIYEILNGKERKEQKTITVTYKALPEDPNQIMSIFLQFLENKLYQSPFSGHSIPDVEKIREDHHKYEIPFKLFERDTGDPVQAFLRSDSYFYVRSSDLNTLIPVGMVVGEKAEASQEKAVSVTVAGKEYYNHVKLIKTKNADRIKIGNSITVEEKDKTLLIKYTPAKYIRQFKQDQEFLLAALNHGVFETNGTPAILNEDQIDEFRKTSIVPEEILNTYQRLVDMMNACGCPKESDGSVDIDYTKLNDTDYRFLSALCRGILEHQELTGISAPEGAFTCFQITNKRIIVGIENTESGIVINKINSDGWKFVAKSPDGVETEIPLCFIFKKKEFESVINIPFEEFIPMLQSVPQTAHLYGYANNLVLDMILAFDSTSGIRKKQLFDTALAVSEWLNTKDTGNGEWDARISRLNNYQLMKRTRELNETEKADIETIIDASDDSDEIRFGAYLLLDNQRRAKTFFEKLDINEQAAYKKMPIYRFWKGKE